MDCLNEPICLARKPLSEKSVAENVLKWGVGGINVDGCRISTNENLIGGAYTSKNNMGTANYALKDGRKTPPKNNLGDFIQPEGRFPANLILECCCDKGDTHTNPDCPCYIMDGQSSGSSRFFYNAKVSKAERNMSGECKHPTLKPINLMTYLCRLITPPNGICLDPFMGSGSTGISAQLEGFRFVGMEMDEEYFKIAEARINSYEKYKKFVK